MGFITDLFQNPQAPSSPDYTNVAQQQGQLNRDAARFGSQLNRPDTVTPFSTSTFRETAPDQFLSTTTLAPEYESIRSQQAANQAQLGQLAGGRLGQIPTDAFSLSNAATYNLPEFSDFNTFTQGAADNFFNRASGRLIPEFDRQETALRTDLINRGIPEGSDAFNTEFNLFNQRKNDALGDLASQSVFQGQNLLGTTMANILTGRQQQLSDALLERSQPFNEAQALLGGQALLPQASSAPPNLGMLAPGAPADILGATQLNQQDRLARYAGDVARQGQALDPFVDLGISYLNRPR